MFGFLRSKSGDGEHTKKDKDPKAEFDRKKDALPADAQKELPDYIQICGPLLDAYPLQTFKIFGRLSRIFIGTPVREFLFAAQPSPYERGGYIPPGATMIPVISNQSLPKEIVVGAYRINPKPIRTDRGIVLFKVEEYVDASKFTDEDIIVMRKICREAYAHMQEELAKKAQNGQ
ncbi:MAG: hypothetical protein QXU54_02205 [Candidatus Micrarchaeia archaeon]